jgi:quinol monooxygenase YgiN
MKNDNVTVFYKWKANEGKLQELKKMYAQVQQDMKNKEPGALLMDFFVDEGTNELLIHDLFENADAVGYHLGVTAVNHFPELLKVATPGPFYFGGDLPQEMKDAALGMGLQAQFTTFIDGFNRKAI